MKRYGDRIQEVAGTTGTADFTLAGAVAGYRPFSAIAGIQAGDTVTYLAVLGLDWEVGTGTYGAGTLARSSVLTSSTGGAKINFPTAPFVLNTLSAEEMASLGQDAVNSVNGKTGVVVLNAGDVGADPVGAASAAESAAKAASDPVGSAAAAQAAAIAASQPRDSNLTAIVAAGSGPDLLNYWQSPGVSALTQILLPGRQFLSQTDAAGQRNVLGLGTAATENSNAFDPAGAAGAAALASQPVDADLTAISGLTGIGYLRRTGTNIWVLETAVGSSYDPYIYKSAVPVSFSNNTTETSLFATAITLPGGVLTEDGQVLEVNIPLKFLNNAGANRAITFKVKLGGVTVFEEVTATLPASAAVRIGALKVNLMRRSPTTCAGGVHLSLSSTTAATIGLGDFAIASTQAIGGFEGAACTWANDTSFDITATFSNATATIQLDTYGASIRK